MERRRAARRLPVADEALARVRVRAGHELRVLDLSSSGALVEGPTRLLPNTHIVIHLLTRSGRVLVRSRIVRAYVSEVRAESLIYRGALVFDRGIDTQPAGYAVPSALVGAAMTEGTTYPPEEPAVVLPGEERHSA
jgi:hypothetical protein